MSLTWAHFWRHWGTDRQKHELLRCSKSRSFVLFEKRMVGSLVAAYCISSIQSLFFYKIFFNCNRSVTWMLRTVLWRDAERFFVSRLDFGIQLCLFLFFFTSPISPFLFAKVAIIVQHFVWTLGQILHVYSLFFFFLPSFQSPCCYLRWIQPEFKEMLANMTRFSLTRLLSKCRSLCRSARTPILRGRAKVSSYLNCRQFIKRRKAAVTIPGVRSFARSLALHGQVG